MPIIRKVVSYGKTSKGIILPKTWLEYYEEESGQQIKKVIVEINGELRIKPVLKRHQREDSG